MKENKGIIVLSVICALISLFVCIAAVRTILAEKEEIKVKIEVVPVKNQMPVETVVQIEPEEEPTPTPIPIPTPTTTKKPKKARKNPKKQKAGKIKNSDIFRLAQLISAENGGAEDDDCLVLTGIVVMKRVKSRSFPNTIDGVISQGGQCSTYPALLNKNPSERCLEIAEEILRWNLQKNYPDSLVFQSEFRQGNRVYRQIRHEYFCLAK